MIGMTHPPPVHGREGTGETTKALRMTELFVVVLTSHMIEFGLEHLVRSQDDVTGA